MPAGGRELPACRNWSSANTFLERTGPLVRKIFLAFVIVWLAHPSRADSPLSFTNVPLSRLGVFEAITLGVVEGVTEFLPISSTGHLIAITHLLDLDSEHTLFDEAGEPLWHRKPDGEDPGELLTVKLATQAYIVVIQFGAIAAIVPICWSQLMAMCRGLIGRDPKGLRLLVNLLIAFLPAAGLGLLVHDWVDENLFSMSAVIFALVAGALLMFFADLWPAWLKERQGFRAELTPLGAAGIGVMQCLAMWPGTSRPMMTIVGGYFAGLAPGPAAGFSFLLGFVTLSAATIYKSYQSGDLIIQFFGWQNVLLGILVAGLTASISVRFFVKLLLRDGLSPFAWYRLALAVFLLLTALS
jgi:undecaprenyl-diphosphatase